MIRQVLLGLGQLFLSFTTSVYKLEDKSFHGLGQVFLNFKDIYFKV